MPGAGGGGGWGIDCHERKKRKSPGVCQGSMVTSQIEPCIRYKLSGSPTLESLLVKW